MKPRVYLETTIPSYLTAWPSRDLYGAMRQQLTKDWWDKSSAHYELCVSDYVVRECMRGDPVAAAARMALIGPLVVLPSTPLVGLLSASLVRRLGLPVRAELDASHIAISAVHSIEFLLTWNCTHIANAHHRKRIEEVCREMGLSPPVICTPEELRNLS